MDPGKSIMTIIKTLSICRQLRLSALLHGIIKVLISWLFLKINLTVTRKTGFNSSQPNICIFEMLFLILSILYDHII